MRNTITILLNLLLSGIISAQVIIPADDQTKPIMLTGGTAHLGNGQVIENAAIGFEKGKITVVDDATKANIDKSYYEVIDIKGKHVYPGFIAPNTTLGLREIDQVRATLDIKELGSLNPNVRTIIAYNTDSEIIPTVRSNGVLLAQIASKGGIISGTSSIVELDAWNWEDAAYKMDEGIYMYWPGKFKNTGWWAEPGPIEKNNNRDKHLKLLDDFFDDAKSYIESSQTKEQNLKLEAIRGIFDGTKTLYIRSNTANDMMESVLFAQKKGVKKTVIVGGRDAWRIAGFLKEKNIPVILSRVHALPAQADDDVDMPFKQPGILQKAGVLFCIGYMGAMEAMGLRNLPFSAGTAATYGLTKEEAIQAITLNTAKILGIDKTVGSIEKGKDATIIVSTGDVLDMRTNNIEYAFIRGKKINLDNRQKQLYEKYKVKYKID